MYTSTSKIDSETVTASPHMSLRLQAEGMGCGKDLHVDMRLCD